MNVNLLYPGKHWSMFDNYKYKIVAFYVKENCFWNSLLVFFALGFTKRQTQNILPKLLAYFLKSNFFNVRWHSHRQDKTPKASLTKHTHGMSVSHKRNFIFRFLFFNFEIVVCIWIPSVHKTVDHENIVWSQRKVLELILFCLNFAEAYEVMSIFTKTVEKNVI
jgi:hypothetical protein